MTPQIDTRTPLKYHSAKKLLKHWALVSALSGDGSSKADSPNHYESAKASPAGVTLTLKSGIYPRAVQHEAFFIRFKHSLCK